MLDRLVDHDIIDPLTQWRSELKPSRQAGATGGGGGGVSKYCAVQNSAGFLRTFCACRL